MHAAWGHVRYDPPVRVCRGEPSKSRAITALAISPASAEAKLAALAVARAGGAIDILSTADGTPIATLAVSSSSAVASPGDAEVRSLSFLSHSQSDEGWVRARRASLANRMMPLWP